MKGIKIIDQDPALPYGNGSPFISAKPLLEGEEAFAALFADDLVLAQGNSGIKQLIEFYENSDADAVLGVQEVPDSEKNRYGMIKPLGEAGDSGRLEMLIEKPKIEEAPSNLASYGRFVVPFRIFDYLKPDARGKDDEIWLQDANDKLAREANVMYKVINGRWYTTGDPIRFFEANLRFMLADERFSSETKALLGSIS
jgi:UTP--glucose-1-phosphate uridylyltransferase